MQIVYSRVMVYVLALLGIYVLVCLLAFVFQSRLIYFPETVVLGTPADRGMEYREVWLDSDGERIHAWYLPGDPGRPALLFCHGNGGNLTWRLDSLEIFHALGLHVLIFDYRGYGQSSGRTTEAGTYADATAAWRYLAEEKGFPPEQIVIFGRSLGGAVAVELASRVGPGGLIVESSFSSAVDLGKRVYPLLPVSLIARHRYEARSFIGGVTCPKLFLHSRGDDVIPFGLGHKLFELAPEPKRFLELHGNHNDGFAVTGRAYVAGLEAFIDSLAGS